MTARECFLLLLFIGALVLAACLHIEAKLDKINCPTCPACIMLQEGHIENSNIEAKYIINERRK